MRRALLMVFSLLIPIAFAGGYMLATANARVVCVLQVPREAHGMPAVCADISVTGIATGLGFGVVGLIVWAIGWAVAWFSSSRSSASSVGSSLR